MQKLLIATKNPGKFREISNTLKGLPYELVFLRELGIEDADFAEDGDTHEANAFKKAKYYHDKTGLLSLGEDSGIYVNALHGELGVTTRRWGAGEHASDAEWLDHFLEQMSGATDRGAKFECSACLYGDGVEKYFDGETAGVILDEVVVPVKEGIPLGSCFLPDGCDKVYAAMSEEDKNEISHRGKAIAQVKAWLEG